MPEFSLPPDLVLPQTAQAWVNVTLIWIGFGAVVGLAARIMIPGREPRGIVGTLVIGILGTVAGPLLLTTLDHHPNFNPISPLGFLVSTAGAFTLLTLYRVIMACLPGRSSEELHQRR